MRSPVRLSCALGLALLWPSSGWSAPKSKSTDGADSSKKSVKEISADDGFQKQMDWENKLLGPNTEKKIDLAKIQKLQAEETARREKQDKLDKVDKERKEREAALAAQRQDVKAPSTREVPSVEEAPPPPKPVEKHDDAFVDKLLKDGKSGEHKHAAVSNDDVDQLLNKAKQDNGATITPKVKSGRADSVDQLLATADKQQAIKTTVRKPAEAEPVSAEAAAREATLKAIAAATAKAEEERNRNRRPTIPDAAMLAHRQPAAAVVREAPAAPRAIPGKQSPVVAAPAPAPAPQTTTAWKDPFANEAPAAPARRAKVSATIVPSTARHGAAGRHAPSTRPAGNDSAQDPFEGGGANKARPAAPKKSRKRSAHWKDPFA
jgi:hypothetical protein